MNPKIFKYLKLKAELSAEELQQADALAAMSEGDKLALLELWDLKPKSKPVTTRKIAKCGTCNFTRRALHHRDSSVKGYHEFDESSSPPKPKSSRASSLAQKIAGTTAARPLDGGVSKMRCAFEGCGEYADNPVHDSLMGYAGYHEFDSGQEAMTATGD